MAGGTSGSVFRVGDNVDLSRVLAMVSILVVVIMIFERLVHKLEHHLHKYPKYHEMMTKVFGELMILGLIGLGIKILKELSSLDWYSQSMIAFQAADITVFLVAIALILQAIIVFLRMRRKNIQVDKAELISTQHLVDLMAQTGLPTWFVEFSAMFTYMRSQNRKKITKADIPEVAQMRILRHFFIKSYGLPELFPFSKYLRQAQDNQISHMIEVEMSMWIMLLLVAWGLDAASQLAEEHWTENYSIVVVFLVFSWLSVVLHAAITFYFTWAIEELLSAAVDGTHRANRYLYLNEIADHEAQAMSRELAADAIAIMEAVRQHERTKSNKRKHRTHDTGFQLLAACFRSLCSCFLKPDPKNEIFLEEIGRESRENKTPTQGPRIHLRWFSRKAWHFTIMSTLMLNAFYVALFCQCIIYQMRPIYHEFGLAVMCFIPVPLIVNMFVFQPRILRNFILVSSIIRVDDTALGDVIDHFTETVQLRASFVRIVHAYLESANQTITDIQNEFESRDTTKSGFLESEEVRLVLNRFGFKLSYFRFNSVAKLLFDLNGIKIEYAQVLRLLELGRTSEVRLFANHSDNSFFANNSAHNSGENGELRLTSTFLTFDPANATTPDEPTSSGNRSQLLRAKSSAAASLYHMDWDEPDQVSPRSTLPTPISADYLQM